MTTYIPTIGLEIHAELKTQTKMFCRSKNDPNEKRPNVNVCPVCMGHPGTLPTANKEAVRQVLKVGLALGSRLADYTEFDRKNYFYPDLPKGYQISQYKYPLVLGGSLNNVAITRVHLEEDTGRSAHEGDYSLVDFNRAGVPLMELVTEPVITSAKEAGDFARELQLLLRALGVSEANMEKGEMRVEANVSVSAQQNKKGTKVEVKNLNSFKAVEKAIEFEIKRQSDVLEKRETIIQETRGWDENKQKTFSQRLKEESHDYRYFPDPDLPSFRLSDIPEFADDFAKLKKELPELPWKKRERLQKEFGLSPKTAEIFVADPVLGNFFDVVVMECAKDEGLVKLCANYISSDLLSLINTRPEINWLLSVMPREFVNLMKMAQEGKVSSRGAKDTLAHLFAEGGSVEEIAKQKGLLQQSNEGALAELVTKVIAEHKPVAEEYKKGKEASLQYLIGQGMKLSKGSANPEVLKRLLIEKLK